LSNTEKNKNKKSKLPNSILEKIEKIRLNNTSGSTELAKQAAEILIFLVNNFSDNSPSKLINYINDTSNELIKAQPVMASIFNLANTTLLENIGLKDKDEIKQNVRNSCYQFIQHLKLSSKIISELTVKIIKDEATIITHSYSSTLLNTLIFAKEFGKNFNIICTESRPMNEGVQLAKQLGKKGISVKLMIDAGVYSVLQDADLILVGADAVSSSGFVNKIGTYGLAIAAKQYNKTFYALCGIDKILPKEYPIIFKYQKNPKEIFSQSIKNVTPINYYFDLTPLEFITGIITEKGILSQLEIQEHISKLPIHRFLLSKY
jgi:translation initiation factor 2B subunit (eIF-2B alpha/beta/delta family)